MQESIDLGINEYAVSVTYHLGMMSVPPKVSLIISMRDEPGPEFVLEMGIVQASAFCAAMQHATNELNRELSFRLANRQIEAAETMLEAAQALENEANR